MRKSTRITLALAGLSLFAAGAAHAQVIKNDGSSLSITEAVAEEFQKAKKNAIKVTVGISGTGGGFKKFSRGETDLSNASRPITPRSSGCSRVTASRSRAWRRSPSRASSPSSPRAPGCPLPTSSSSARVLRFYVKDEWFLDLVVDTTDVKRDRAPLLAAIAADELIAESLRGLDEEIDQAVLVV